MTRKSKIINTTPDVLFFGTILGAYFLDRYLPVSEIVPTPLSYAGWLLVVVGLMLAIRSVTLLKSRHASTDVVRTSSVLIVDDLYAYSRNPLYVSELAVVIGVAVACGSLAAFVMPCIYAITIQLYVIPFEERDLQKEFSQSYEQYKHQVRRWL